MQITVHGHATAAFPPERATVHVTLGYEGPEKQSVLALATRLANEFGAAVDQIRQAPNAPITWSAMLPISTRNWRPYSNDGTVAPMRYGASATAKVKFRDFVELSRFIDQWGARDGVTIQGVDWALTENRRVHEEDAVLARAVESARSRAQTMARAAGFEKVRFVELADPGLLLEGTESVGGPAYGAMARSAMDGGGPGVSLLPEDIELEASVHARFTTD